MSVEKRSTAAGDRFLVRWREHGRQRSRSFERRADARAWDIEVRRRAQLGPLAVTQLTSKGPTLAEWIAERWVPEHGVSLEASTRRRYADAFRIHIEAELGDRPLRDITVSVLRAWQSGRVAAGVSAGTIEKCRTLLSSVLRHAAESEAILANPMSLVRAPKAEYRDAVKPLAPATVESIRRVLLAPMDAAVPARVRGGVQVSGYLVADERDALARLTDAAIVSLLAYAGLRAGELRALRWGDIGEKTLTVERAADDDGRVKATKTNSRRSVRLLPALAADLRELRLAAGRPAGDSLILSRDGAAWSKTDWQVWRAKRWTKACRLAGLPSAPRPYDLRHSFASLLLAEGRAVHYVAAQLGHSPTLTLTTYGHLFAEYEDADRIDAAIEIEAARGTACVLRVHSAAV